MDAYSLPVATVVSAAGVTAPGLALINRAVMVLGAFTHGPGTVLPLGELIRRTGLPKTTLHRLLAALEVSHSCHFVSAAATRHDDRVSDDESVSRRERIVRVAAELFLERAFDSVTMDDVITAAGGFKGDALRLLRQQGGAAARRGRADLPTAGQPAPRHGRRGSRIRCRCRVRTHRTPTESSSSKGKYKSPAASVGRH